ncbi:hypothetical protein JTB14_004681 [Gonioctena quinquepunctata]|nr:hypothetical protein JTB14_004681 [Gonioctena quinquepunctata]
MVSEEVDSKNKTLLGYKLTPRQDAIVNHLVPSVCACILYMFIIAGDVGVVVSHYRNGDPIWASLTLFFMYLPVIGSFVIIVSNWELWPEFLGCGRKNLIWFCLKVAEHLVFPVWNMWRFAERIFWSIEAVRAKDDKSIKEALARVSVPRSIELYIFLQSYLHALPQVLLQLYILMRHNSNINRQTASTQTLSLILNLAKVSITTTYYQRFKSQKLTGKQYPWYKQYKAFNPTPSSTEVVLRNPDISQPRLVVEERRNTSALEEKYDLEPPIYLSERRRSSDIYLEPTVSSEATSKRQTLLETDFDEEVQTKEKYVDEGFDEIDRPPSYSSRPPTTLRGTSVLDGPKRSVFRETGILNRSEPDFNISRVIYVKGLEDDDLAGKLIAFLWWFTFLLARVLAISAYAYFFFEKTIWLLCSHFLIVIAFLVYDVKSDEVRRSKAIFFMFLGLIYIFCIIEFKIKFKKAAFIYYGYFILVFTENLVMCLIWYLGEVESIENDFWFRYVFYIVVTGSICSFSSMVFYFIINKPPKVVIPASAIQKYV